jgi:hypothetical protein
MRRRFLKAIAWLAMRKPNYAQRGGASDVVCGRSDQSRRLRKRTPCKTKVS